MNFFVSTCFNTCAKLNIEIIDYVICNAQTHYSFRDGLGIKILLGY